MSLSPALDIILRGGFSPKRLPGLALWLDASQIGGLNDGDPVATWSDVSGLGAASFIQATGAKKPGYKVNVINGYPAVLFDGVDDILTSTFNMGAAPNTTFVVFSPVAFGAPNADPTLSPQVVAMPGAIGDWGLTIDNTPRAKVYRWNGGAYVSAVATIAAGSWYITRVRELVGTGLSLKVNTSSEATSALVSASTGSGLRIGGDDNAAAFANIYVTEIAVSTQYLSTAVCNQMERYLSAKYGLAVS